MYGFGLDDQDQVFYYMNFNGSSGPYLANWTSTNASNRAIGATLGAVLDFDGTDDYVQIYIESGQNAFTIDNGGYGSSNIQTKQLSSSHFFGYKLIGV